MEISQISKTEISSLKGIYHTRKRPIALRILKKNIVDLRLDNRTVINKWQTGIEEYNNKLDDGENT